MTEAKLRYGVMWWGEVDFRAEPGSFAVVGELHLAVSMLEPGTGRINRDALCGRPLDGYALSEGFLDEDLPPTASCCTECLIVLGSVAAQVPRFAGPREGETLK